ncbi:hypothetical protein KHQ82_05315 [Mycoplasmatota bacterium]|nr:hypothetical protein KHQ82_05315 [Mycoplasmatota bacterium]
MKVSKKMLNHYLCYLLDVVSLLFTVLGIYSFAELMIAVGLLCLIISFLLHKYLWDQDYYKYKFRGEKE